MKTSVSASHKKATKVGRGKKVTPSAQVNSAVKTAKLHVPTFLDYATAKDKPHFWNSLIASVGAVPLTAKPLRGVTGHLHDALAIGIDTTQNRLIVVVSETDPKLSAFAQLDLQQAHPKENVLVVRPVAFSLSRLALAINQVLGSTSIGKFNMPDFETVAGKAQATEIFSQAFSAIPTLAKNIQLKMLPQILDVVQQLAKLRIHGDEVKELFAGPQEMNMDFSDLLNYDPVASDREYGICGVPLYAFDGREVESLCSGTDAGAIQEILRRHGVLEYFFPPADGLAISIADRQAVTATTLQSCLDSSTSIGHPLSSHEFLPATARFHETIDQLQARKFLVQGERTLEIGPEGTKIRESIKFKPREGLVSKIITLKANASI
jgi:hypothetical protein